MNELNFSVIRKMSMSTIYINRQNLQFNFLVDVDGFKWCIQFVVGHASPSDS